MPLHPGRVVRIGRQRRDVSAQRIHRDQLRLAIGSTEIGEAALDSGKAVAVRGRDDHRFRDVATWSTISKAIVL